MCLGLCQAQRLSPSFDVDPALRSLQGPAETQDSEAGSPASKTTLFPKRATPEQVCCGFRWWQVYGQAEVWGHWQLWLEQPHLFIPGAIIELFLWDPCVEKVGRALLQRKGRDWTRNY